jgi:23S rRNA pseudouridine1911/1915/1917 synthase
MADGRPSVTHYSTLEAHRFASLLEVHLETGRTHQIRVHMAALKHPCVGTSPTAPTRRWRRRFGWTGSGCTRCGSASSTPTRGSTSSTSRKYPDDLAHALELVRAAD